MHGQKKRHKRHLAGSFVVSGMTLNWTLLSEPQWTTEHGAKGLCISVQLAGGRARELILQYPFPLRPEGGVPVLPQRPDVSEKEIQVQVFRAMEEGWDPASRGKARVLIV